jgi:hypothetical protein
VVTLAVVEQVDSGLAQVFPYPQEQLTLLLLDQVEPHKPLVVTLFLARLLLRVAVLVVTLAAMALLEVLVAVVVLVGLLEQETHHQPLLAKVIVAAMDKVQVQHLFLVEVEVGLVPQVE